MTESLLITDFLPLSIQEPVVEMSWLLSKDIIALEKHRESTLQPLK